MKHVCKNCYYMDVDFASCFGWLHDIDVYLTMTCNHWRDKNAVET